MTSRARARLLPVAILALTLVVAACSSSSDERSGTSTAPPLSTSDVAAKPARVFTLVSMNVLHGATCDDGPGHCAVADRFALLAQDLEHAGCPDVVALQEVASWWRALLDARLPTVCDGAYHLVSPPNALDAVRVDDIFLRATAGCRPFYGLRTGLFAASPSRNGPGGIVWISDHAGAELELSCP